MSRLDLKGLRLAASKACREAVKARADLNGEAVNWADLDCVRAELAIDDEGQETYRVWIEEASPDASGLQNFIGEWLTEVYGLVIEVRTEW